jgi:hypothetical protein
VKKYHPQQRATFSKAMALRRLHFKNSFTAELLYYINLIKVRAPLVLLAGLHAARAHLPGLLHQSPCEPCALLRLHLLMLLNSAAAPCQGYIRLPWLSHSLPSALLQRGIL